VDRQGDGFIANTRFNVNKSLESLGNSEKEEGKLTMGKIRSPS
jgi:hypothetical protein